MHRHIASLAIFIVASFLALHAGPAAAASSNATPASPPKEAVFNLKDVLKNYSDTKLEVLDISERSYDGKNALAVTLSVPLNPADNHNAYFNVSSPDGGKVDGAWVLSKSGKVAWFPSSEPNTKYDVTVYTGLKAANNKTLAETFSKQIRTRHLNPAVTFDTRGSVLPAGINGGLPVVTVNIDSVDINFFRMRDDKLQNFLNHALSNRNYYWDIDRLTREADLAYTARLDLKPPKNTRKTYSIPIESNPALSKPGVYMAVMNEAGKYNSKKEITWFSVSDLGLHARVYKNQLDIHVASLKTGLAQAGVVVTLYGNDGKILHESKTTPDGLASFINYDDDAKYIIAKQNNYVTTLVLSQPALDLSEFDIGNRPHLPTELFVYIPRDLYRPGETVDFSALLRDGDGKNTQGIPIDVTIKKPDGTQAYKTTIHPQDLNYYSFSYSIPSGAPTGNWQLTANGASIQFPEFKFKVEEFLPERMKLTFKDSDEESIIKNPDDEIKAAILGEYLYGAPASGNRLSTIVNVTQAREPIAALKGYQFGDIKETSQLQKFNLSDVELDSKGEAVLDIESRWSYASSPLNVKLISSLYETGGRPVARTHSYLIWPKETLIGIRPQFGDKNPEANSLVSFDIVNATPEGKLLAATALDVRLIREDRQYFWEYSDSQGWHYEHSESELPEVTKTLDIPAGKSATQSFRVEWGGYRLEVTNVETQAKTSVRFYAGWNWYENWQQAQKGQGAARPDKTVIALDKKDYRAGDIAKVKIVPSSPGETLVLVEGDKALWMKKLFIPAEGAIVSIPISKDWKAHNIYISTVTIQAGSKEQKITPKRSFGLAYLPLYRDDRHLTVDVSLPEKVLPNQTLNIPVKVNGLGKTDTAYITVAAVDVGILSISNFKTPDPFEYFFGQRRYGVDVRDMYRDIIEISNNPFAKQRFGGDADLSRGGTEPQSEVQIVSLFSGLVKVDGQGMATVPLDIPDFNGRLRFMALGFTEDKFGNGEKEVTIASPIVAQMALPRFLAGGDTTTIALDINNLSGKAQELQVRLAASGTASVTADSKKLALQDKEKVTLIYPVKADQQFGDAKFAMTIEGKDLEAPIKQTWHLGVRPAYPAITKSSRKVLDKGDMLSMSKDELESYIPNTVESQLTVSSKANMNVRDQLKQLLQYPYGCLEQTSSRAYPLTYATPENQALFNLDPISEEERIKRIKAGIDRIATMQLHNGGYGLWNNKSAEEHWLTVYVADFLISAQAQGIDIPKDMLDKTISRLKQYVNQSGGFVDQRWSESPQHYTVSYKAYAAYVLSRVNKASLGSTRTLYDNEISKAETPLPMLHIAIALLKQGDQTRGNEALGKALAFSKYEKRYYGDYGSRIRDMAVMIHLLLSNNLEKKKAFEMSYVLADEVQRSRYLSTQERNSLFLAGIQLEGKVGENWQAQLMVNNEKQMIDQNQTFSRIFKADQLQAPLSVTNKTDGPLYASFDTVGYPEKPPAPYSNGLEVKRSFYDIQGKTITPEKVKVGDLYVVHLAIHATANTPDALVVDLLSAGFEIENQNLDTAIKMDEFKIEEQTIAELTGKTKIKYVEFRDDRYVAAIDMQSWHDDHLFYLVRAVTPGIYSVPPTVVEDMYRPEIRGLGQTFDQLEVANP